MRPPPLARFVPALMALVAWGCAGGVTPHAPSASTPLQQPHGGLAGEPRGDVAPARREAGAAAPKAGAEAPPARATVGRSIVRRAELTVDVASGSAAVAAIERIARDSGGFVSDEALDATEGEAPHGRIVLRVPAARFDAVLDAFGGVGAVRQRQVTGEDVTLQVVDTRSRLRNLKVEEDRLLALMGRTGRLAEVLEVERELARVRGEIDETTGRLRELDGLVDLATLTVSWTQQVREAVTSPWDVRPVAQDAWQAAQLRLAHAVAWGVRGAIALAIGVLPLLLPAIAVYLLLGRLLTALLVGRHPWWTRRRIRVVWGALGGAALVALWPPLLALAAVVALGLWASAAARPLLDRWLSP